MKEERVFFASGPLKTFCPANSLSGKTGWCSTLLQRKEGGNSQNCTFFLRRKEGPKLFPWFIGHVAVETHSSLIARLRRQFLYFFDFYGWLFSFPFWHIQLETCHRRYEMGFYLRMPKCKPKQRDRSARSLSPTRVSVSVPHALSLFPCVLCTYYELPSLYVRLSFQRKFSARSRQVRVNAPKQ